MIQELCHFQPPVFNYQSSLSLPNLIFTKLHLHCIIDIVKGGSYGGHSASVPPYQNLQLQPCPFSRFFISICLIANFVNLFTMVFCACYIHFFPPPNVSLLSFPYFYGMNILSLTINPFDIYIGGLIKKGGNIYEFPFILDYSSDYCLYNPKNY